jgi:hypothetical protein
MAGSELNSANCPFARHRRIKRCQSASADHLAQRSRLQAIVRLGGSAHRSLIAFAAWSSFAHPAVMSTQGFEIASQRSGFLDGSVVLVVIGLALILLADRKLPEQQGVAA